MGKDRVYWVYILASAIGGLWIGATNDLCAEVRAQGECGARITGRIHQARQLRHGASTALSWGYGFGLAGKSAEPTCQRPGMTLQLSTLKLAGVLPLR